MLAFLASTGVSLGPIHLTSGEAWLTFGFILGLLTGWHMAQPRWIGRRRD